MNADPPHSFRHHRAVYLDVLPTGRVPSRGRQHQSAPSVPVKAKKEKREHTLEKSHVYKNCAYTLGHTKS